MIAAYQARCQKQVDAALEPLFAAPRAELGRLYAAMRYSVFNGGKRVRPLLAYGAVSYTHLTLPTTPYV